MSMFYELMMRKKEETMYATIKGTLTENDGVLTNFSTTNWLSLPPMPTANPYYIELNIKFNSGDMSLNSYIWLYQVGEEESSTGLRIYNGNQIAFFVGYSNKYLAFNATANTDYWVRFTRGKTVNTSQLQYSTDGINYVTAVNGNIYNSDTMEFMAISTTLNMRFGRSVDSTSNYLKGGSIDLNASSIKINSTKYNLQAVVGYTVVGSPTIVDGVVSGFSNSSYLSLPTAKNTDTTEICMKINIPSSSLNQSRYMSALYGCISITTYSGASAFTYSVINTSGLGDLSIGTLQPDTNYWIKYINDGTNCSAWLSEDGISFLKKAEKSASLIVETSALNSIGGSGSRYFGGSIDLNETYIKINNKLWFNGQQA